LITDSAVAVITGSDMMTISQALTVTDSSVEGVVESIPSGLERTVTIFVYDTNQVVRYQVNYLQYSHWEYSGLKWYSNLVQCKEPSR
jgi:heptaprenylglyceryl phosphate synthase